MSVIETFAQFPTLFIGACLLLGLLVGSFLNVVIYRVPLMLERQWREQCAELAAAGRVPCADTAAKPPEPFNLVVPRSACPSCKAPITALQNIPVVSYLFLKGKCALCGVPIPRRYPFIEALTGVMSAAVAWKLGFGLPALAGLVLTWYLIALTFIDVDTQLLPDNLTLPLLWLGLFASLWGPAANGGPIPVDLRTSVIGALAGYISLWLVYHAFRLLTGKEGMGYGDFKLFAALGAWLGWQMLLPIILIAAAVGAVSGIVILSMQKQDRSTPIAFGPFLAASGWLMLMFGQELVQRYLGLFARHS
jgi:leader peptidase (prepilin peptidase)/N-methyltransferase